MWYVHNLKLNFPTSRWWDICRRFCLRKAQSRSPRTDSFSPLKKKSGKPLWCRWQLRSNEQIAFLSEARQIKRSGVSLFPQSAVTSLSGWNGRRTTGAEFQCSSGQLIILQEDNEKENKRSQPLAAFIWLWGMLLLHQEENEQNSYVQRTNPADYSDLVQVHSVNQQKAPLSPLKKIMCKRGEEKLTWVIIINYSPGCADTLAWKGTKCSVQDPDGWYVGYWRHRSSF